MRRICEKLNENIFMKRIRLFLIALIVIFVLSALLSIPGKHILAFLYILAGPFSYLWTVVKPNMPQPLIVHMQIISLGLITILGILAHPIYPRKWTGMITIFSSFVWVAVGTALTYFSV